jgi:hypothetical protein
MLSGLERMVQTTDPIKTAPARREYFCLHVVFSSQANLSACHRLPTELGPLVTLPVSMRMDVTCDVELLRTFAAES